MSPPVRVAGWYSSMLLKGAGVAAAVLCSVGCLDTAGLSRCYRAPTVPVAPEAGYASGPPFWIGIDALQTSRRQLTLFSAGQLLYAVGGSAGTQTLASAEQRRVDPEAATTWMPTPSLPTPRSQAAGAVDLDGRLVLLGGSDGANELSSVARLAPNAAEWDEGAPLSAPRRSFAAAVDPCGDIMVMGGSSNGDEALSSVEVFSRGTWSSAPGLTLARSRLAAATDPAGSVWALGGVTKDKVTLTTVESWDLPTHSWKRGPEMTTPRALFAAVYAPDGRIYAIAGGQMHPSSSFSDVASYIKTASVEAFSPVTQRWESVAPLPLASVSHGAVVGADGRIYVVGGDNGNPLGNTTVYGPSIHLSTTRGASGTRSQVTGQNFAANAVVQLWWGDLSGQLIGSGMTDSRGEIATPIEVMIPAVNAGPGVITAMDQRSAYPVRTTFTVTR
jgi:hypothetical protein